MYNLIIRPLLFCIDPEKVHRMLLSWLKFYRYLFPVRACVRGYSRVSDPFSYGHLQFKNRIGLSAGFDKNAEAFDELADFGFGFLEVGTVTPDSQSGNPSPRIFRLVDDESLISRTGFNNCGVDAVRQHIRKYRKHSKTQKEFYLFETHMPLADNARKHACQMLVDAVSDKAKDNTPAFCTGDFNATPDAPEIATTICQSGILKDAYREAAVQHGALFTFPSKKTRIDFIFVKHATVLSTRTIVSSLSDHYPMVIVVEI